MLENLVFLTTTDTTIGFISQNSTKLDRIKNRPPHKKYIKAINSLKTLKQHTRVPNRFKNQILFMVALIVGLICGVFIGYFINIVNRQ